MEQKIILIARLEACMRHTEDNSKKIDDFWNYDQDLRASKSAQIAKIKNFVRLGVYKHKQAT